METERQGKTSRDTCGGSRWGERGQHETSISCLSTRGDNSETRQFDETSVIGRMLGAIDERRDETSVIGHQLGAVNEESWGLIRYGMGMGNTVVFGLRVFTVWVRVASSDTGPNRA